MRTCLFLRDYEDIIDPCDIYSLLGMAYTCRCKVLQTYLLFQIPSNLSPFSDACYKYVIDIGEASHLE